MQTSLFDLENRYEHVLGHMPNSMGGIFLDTIGAARAKVGGWA
jgi:hypothetical protein